jgi:FPC/CPF motif-containing protein YcgG
MKINFILKKIPNIQSHQNFSICTNIKYTDISSYQISNNNNTNDHNSNFSSNLIDENFEFIYNNNTHILIVDFKEKICSEKNFSLDSLNLFYLNNNNFEELNDNEKFEKIFKINSIKKIFTQFFIK